MTTPSGTESPSDGLRHAAAAALADVDALTLTGQDRTVVLEALLRARLGGLTPVPPGQNSVSGTTQDSSGSQQTPIDDGDVIGKVSAALKVDRDALELVYALQDGEPHVVISSKKVSGNKALGTRQLGQLVAVARQIAGLEEWTSSSTIRKVVTDYGRLDGSNFAATLQQMDDVAVVRGKGQQREVKITKPGIEKTAELIKSLTGAES